MRAEVEPAPGELAGQWLAGGGAPKRTFVDVSQLSSVEKSRLEEKIGSPSGARVKEILDGLRFRQRSFFGR